MSSPPDRTEAEQDLRFHTYSSHVIPWYVPLMWLMFWVFAIGYALSNFVPAIQNELLTPP